MVVVFGTVCLDRMRRLPHLPVPGGYVEAIDESVVLGGEAANTALAISAWGTSPVLASNPLGEDAEGDLLRRLVLKRGLDLRELGRPKDARAPLCDVFVTPDGERTMIGRGFTALDRAVDLSKLPLQSGGFFAADPNMAMASREAARFAKGAGMRTYLMDFLGEDEPLSPGSIWQVSAEDVGARGDPRAACVTVDTLVARTGAFAILTNGSRGVISGGVGLPARSYPPFPAPKVVDTTGAGDVFRAGMLFGLDRGWAFSACLQFASAAGALSVGYPGASSQLPTLEAVAALIADHPQIALAYAAGDDSRRG